MHRTDTYSEHSSIIWPAGLNGWVFVYEISGCGFVSSCRHLNFRFHAWFEQGVPWHSGSYRVWIHPETRTWNDENIESFILKVYFVLNPFDTADCHYFASNLRLTLLVKVFFTKQHVMLFCSILNIKKYFHSWFYFCVYPLFHLVNIVKKIVFKSWMFRKQVKKAHYVPSQSAFRSFWLRVLQEGIHRHHLEFFHADKYLKN